MEGCDLHFWIGVVTGSALTVALMFWYRWTDRYFENHRL